MELLVMDLIKNIIEKNVILVYIFFFVSQVLQLTFPPYPADVVMVFQGYLTSMNGPIFGFDGPFCFIFIYLNAIAGTFAGSFVVYRFGYSNGDAVFKYKLIKKYIDEKHLKRAEKIFKKYGAYAVFISKFVPGVNAILILFAGIFKMKGRSVASLVVFSAVVHHLLMLLLGRFLGYNIKHVKSILTTYNSIIIGLFVLLVVSFIIYRYICKKKPNSENV